MPLNDHGQEVGEPLPSFQPCVRPPHTLLQGTYVSLEPLDSAAHCEQLFSCLSLCSPSDWTYLFFEPPATAVACGSWLDSLVADPTIQVYCIRDRSTSLATGLISFMRLKPRVGVLEIGHVIFSPLLQRSRRGTEAVFLLCSQAFAAGFRRVEWKCDSLNERSRRAALRYGFQAEGTFRQAMVYKGRSRDTAWFAMLDREWAAGLQAAFTGYLAPGNFDSQSEEQLQPLAAFQPK